MRSWHEASAFQLLIFVSRNFIQDGEFAVKRKKCCFITSQHSLDNSEMAKSRKEPISGRRRPNTKGYDSPVQIREGEVLTDITQKDWRVGKAVGAGGFGEIYLVADDISKPVPQDAMYAAKIEPHRNGPLFVEMNFYIRVAKQEMIAKWMKERSIKHLGMPHYISFGSHVYQGERYRFLVLKRFGQDLGKLFNKSKRKFHIKTVLTLGIQILDILEYIHSHGYIHADIKASNLLLGYDDKDRDSVYLLDYGLACRYINNWGQHKEYNPDQRRAHDGTLEYTSRDAHIGAHSRRGDLEVLAYNMIQWLSGKLPWEDEVSDPEKVALEKNNCMSNIPLFLKTCFGDDAPVVLHHFLKYVVSLNFDTKPDYGYCKSLLRQGIRQAGYADDGKLNFTTPPAKLKMKKRYRDADVENFVELKPIKIPRTAARYPCTPVQQNCNRMTRQQAAANTLALRSREPFDWVKVLQSNPEKLLKAEPIKASKRKCEKKNIQEINLTKVKENPMDNPTPAMFEVLKMRNNQGVTANVGKRNRSDSSCSSPVFYEQNSLTPAMEEVIRKREALKRVEFIDFKPVTSTTSARANRLRHRNETKLVKPVPRKSSGIESKKSSRCTSKAKETVEPDNKAVVKKRGKAEPKGNHAERKPKKLPQTEQSKLLVYAERAAQDFSLGEEVKTTRRTSQRIKTKVERSRKRLPTSPRYARRRKLEYNQRKRSRRREVSPSEINFVPRLRSGLDTSEDNKTMEMWSRSAHEKTRIRHYAAKDVSPKVSQVSGDYSRMSVRKRALCPL